LPRWLSLANTRTFSSPDRTDARWGQPLCAAAGVAAMKLIQKENLVERAASKGAELVQTIRNAGVSCVKEVRGVGFMIGIELDKSGRDVVMGCMQKGLLINCTQDKILRLAPALTASDGDLAAGMEILLGVLKG